MCKCGGMPQDFEIFERGRDKAGGRKRRMDRPADEAVRKTE